jgi:hypothetical protein
MELTIPSFPDGGRIPGEYALCVPDPDNHTTMGRNRSPHLRWTAVPEGTQSFAVIAVDPDAPSVADDVNVEGKSISKDLARVDFYHWVLVDIPPTMVELATGVDSDGVTAKGKDTGNTDHGHRGFNDYTSFFEGQPDMEGVYGGYDGPCPPWNDEREHRYIFRVYALDTPSLGLKGDFGGADALDAIAGHVLDSAEWTGLYTLNPDLF